MGWASRSNPNPSTRENLKRRREEMGVAAIPYCYRCGREAIKEDPIGSGTFTVAAETVDGKTVCDRCAIEAKKACPEAVAR